MATETHTAIRRPCQTLLEVPPTCRHIAPPPLSRPVTKRTEVADRTPPSGVTNAAGPEAALGAARYPGTHRGGAGRRAARAARAARRGLPASSATGRSRRRSRPHHPSPHLTSPRPPGAEPRGPAERPRHLPAGRRPPPSRRARPPPQPPIRPAGAGAPRAAPGPAARGPPSPSAVPLRDPGEEVGRCRRNQEVAAAGPAPGSGPRHRAGSGSAQPVSRSRYLGPLGLLGAPRWRLPLAVPAASPGSVSFCRLPPGLFLISANTGHPSAERTSLCAC